MIGIVRGTSRTRQVPPPRPSDLRAINRDAEEKAAEHDEPEAQPPHHISLRGGDLPQERPTYVPFS